MFMVMKRQTIQMLVILVVVSLVGIYYLFDIKATKNQETPISVESTSLKETNQEMKIENKPTLSLSNGDFFLNQKMEREKIQYEQVQTLMAKLSNTNTTEEEKKEIQKELNDIKKNQYFKEKAESVISSYGYKQVVIYDEKGKIHVVVQSSKLPASKASEILKVASEYLHMPQHNLIVSFKP